MQQLDEGVPYDCSSDSHCQPEAPTCVGGICTSNQAPSAWNQSFSVDEMGSTNVNLAASDPDGDPLTFHKRSQNGVSVSWRNQSSGAITISANTCGDSGSFQYRVSIARDSILLAVSSGSINNRRPSLSTNGNKNGGYGGNGYADFSDCGSEANCSRASVWKHSGSGTISELDVVGRGSLTLGNQIAPVNRNL